MGAISKPAVLGRIFAKPVCVFHRTLVQLVPRIRVHTIVRMGKSHQDLDAPDAELLKQEKLAGE
jgi:hypothetical protein